MIELLTIALDSWIVQDGNYGEFRAGDVSAFALEFYPLAEPLEVVTPAAAGPELEHVVESSYRIKGPIVHLHPNWWVVDVGIPIYQGGTPPRDAVLGQWLQGSIRLGIDPFPYFERFALLPGSPPLICGWTIEAIDMQSAPFVEKELGIKERDRTLRGWRRIAQTDTWHDDGGCAEYLLHCRLSSRLPRHALMD